MRFKAPSGPRRLALGLVPPAIILAVAPVAGEDIAIAVINFRLIGGRAKILGNPATLFDALAGKTDGVHRRAFDQDASRRAHDLELRPAFGFQIFDLERAQAIQVIHVAAMDHCVSRVLDMCDSRFAGRINLVASPRSVMLVISGLADDAKSSVLSYGGGVSGVQRVCFFSKLRLSQST